MLPGYFLNGLPRIKLTLVGTAEDEIEVIVDTGFNGALTLNSNDAKRLGLLDRKIIESSKIADGSNSPFLIHTGTVIYNNKRIENTVVEVQPECKTLLGMTLLKQLGLNLFVDPGANKVVLNPTGTGLFRS